MKSSIHNYELLCLFPNEKKNSKEEIINTIKSLDPHQLKVGKLNTEKLEINYLKVARLDIDNYLLVNLRLVSEKAQQIEKLFEQSSIQYLLINKDREKRLKIKSFPNRLKNQEDISNKEEKQIIDKEEE